LKNSLLFCFSIVAFFSCSEKPNIEGLWELQKVDIDMIPRGFKPTYLQINKGGSFYVSKEDGDLTGLYQIDKSLLHLSSVDNKWFNRSWKIFASENELVLNDIRNSYRGAQLRFRRIPKFPDFKEFQQALNGTWELYKTEEKGVKKVISNTRFIIKDDSYKIMEGEVLLEEGNVLIDARHKKMTFKNVETIWNVRFVWDELRLENERIGITYRLKKK